MNNSRRESEATAINECVVVVVFEAKGGDFRLNRSSIDQQECDKAAK